MSDGAIVNTKRLSDKLQERMSELKFRPDDKSAAVPLDLYRERPDLRSNPAPSPRVNTLYSMRFRALRNTKNQRPTEMVHVAHRLELQIGRRCSNKDYTGDQEWLAARAEQVVSWIIARGVGGFTPEWEDIVYELDTVTSVLYATIVFTFTGFWEHSRQFSS